MELVKIGEVWCYVMHLRRRPAAICYLWLLSNSRQEANAFVIKHKLLQTKFYYGRPGFKDQKIKVSNNHYMFYKSKEHIILIDPNLKGKEALPVSNTWPWRQAFYTCSTGTYIKNDIAEVLDKNEMFSILYPFSESVNPIKHKKIHTKEFVKDLEQWIKDRSTSV